MPAGINLGASAFVRPKEGDASAVLGPGVSFVGTGLSHVDRGTHLEATLGFTPEEAGTYYAVVEVAPRNQTYHYQLVSVSVDEGPGGERQSPAPPLALLLAALAVALAVRRRPA